jgi:hypothetical protein
MVSGDYFFDIQLHSNFLKRHGGLKRGDQLLSVNGVSVEGEPHEKAVELLKAAISSVKLVVRYLETVFRIRDPVPF